MQCILNHPTFSVDLYYSLKGAGTGDASLVTIVITQIKIGLVQIKEMFTQMYGKTLSTMGARDMREFPGIVGQ